METKYRNRGERSRCAEFEIVSAEGSGTKTFKSSGYDTACIGAVLLEQNFCVHQAGSTLSRLNTGELILSFKRENLSIGSAGGTKQQKTCGKQTFAKIVELFHDR